MGIRQQTFLAYESFVKKFESKKTTDDCYTPSEIYDVVLSWVRAKYDIAAAAPIIRPFYPNSDYETYDYPPNCVVVDNPPFSILSNIVRTYNRMGVRYFLFAPSLTNFAIAGGNACNHIIAGAHVTYENGAVVETSFVTNMGDYFIETTPDLHDLIEDADKRVQKAKKVQLPKYEFPNEIITAARCGYLVHHHTEFKVKRSECLYVRSLDAQEGHCKAIFGGGFLLSSRAAAERAAADKSRAIFWQLSEREREIQRMLDRDSQKEGGQV